MRSLLLFSLAINFLPASGSADFRGNGGDAVVCRTNSGNIESVRLLDYFEGEYNLGVKPSLGSDSLSVKQKVTVAIDRLKRLDPKRAADYERRLNFFLENVRQLDGVEFVDIPDSEHTVVPSGCAIEQIAIQKEPSFPHETYFKVNSELWTAMNPDHQAGLILHEMIFQEALENGHLDSVKSRYFNTQISSKALDALDAKSYQKLLELVGLPSSPNCNGVTVPGDFHSPELAVAELVARGGGTVCLKPGIYKGFEQDLKGTTIELIGLGSDRHQVVFSSYISLIKGGKAKLENLSFKSMRYGFQFTGAEFDVRHVDITTEEGDGIGVFSPSRQRTVSGTIFDVKIEAKGKTFGDAIAIVSGDNVTIDRCDVRGAMAGIDISSVRGNISVRNCHLHHSTMGILVTPDDMSGEAEVEINHNTLANNKYGLRVQDAKTERPRIIYRDNLFLTNWRAISVGKVSQTFLTHSHNALFENGENFHDNALPGAHYIVSGAKGFKLNLSSAPPVPVRDSVLVGAGSGVNSPKYDVFGRERMNRFDIGAAQFPGID